MYDGKDAHISWHLVKRNLRIHNQCNIPPFAENICNKGVSFSYHIYDSPKWHQLHQTLYSHNHYRSIWIRSRRINVKQERSIIIVDKWFTINVREHIDILLYKKSSDPYAIFSALRSEFYRVQGNEYRDISRQLCVENRVLSSE